MAVIFLDIDGALNGQPETCGCPVIGHVQALSLAALVAATKADIVLTSSWRKWIHQGLMTLDGFSVLLRTHGIMADVIGVLPERALTPRERGPAIKAYAERHSIDHYVVLDDRPLDVPNLVQTDGTVGLTTADVLKAYRILRDGQ